jgi:iron(III) transport system substrate-binding protein
MKRLKRVTAALICAAALQLLVPFGGALAQEAKQKLNFYSALAEPFNEALLAGFNKAHPDVEVTTLRLVSGALATRFYTEAASGLNQADVIIVATPELFDKNPEWFKPLAGTSGYENWPDNLKTANHVKALFGLLKIFYNSNNVAAEDAPKTWEDLLDPRWKSRAVMIDPASSATYLSWALNMQKKFGDAFLKGLAEQELTIANGGLDAAQAVASGAADIAFPGSPNHVQALLKQGAPIKVVDVGDPSLGNEISIAIAAAAPNPDAAQIFFDWYLSQAGQEISCKFFYSSGLSGTPGCEPLPDDFITPTFGIPEAKSAELTRLLTK